MTFVRYWGPVLLYMGLIFFSSEWHQLSVPGREGSLSDALADGAGAVVGGLVLTAISAVSGIAGETR